MYIYIYICIFTEALYVLMLQKNTASLCLSLSLSCWSVMKRILLLSMTLFAFHPWVLIGRLIFRHVAQVASVSALSGT